MLVSRALAEIASSLRSVSESRWISSFSSPAVSGYILAVSRSFSILSPFAAPAISRKIGAARAAKISISFYALLLFLLSFVRHPFL